MSNVIKLAIQKSGRLSDSTLKLLNECGIRFNNSQARLTSKSTNFDIELLFLRDDDIPGYVESGVADAGIAGENIVTEHGSNVKILKKLDYGKCRLSIAVPKHSGIKNINGLKGKKIATSYPNLLKKFLQKNKISAEIHTISGSVEIAPAIGLADAICDLVSTGSTLISNGLSELEVILKSEAILIASKKSDSSKSEVLSDLLFRIEAVNSAKSNKYILLNAPEKSLNEIIKILPGIKSPTILPLAQKGWVSMHSVVNENDFWHVTDKLKKAGAQGILVIPIEKMIV
jgi:ATP phosphoribosyltransferase